MSEIKLVLDKDNVPNVDYITQNDIITFLNYPRGNMELPKEYAIISTDNEIPIGNEKDTQRGVIYNTKRLYLVQSRNVLIEGYPISVYEFMVFRPWQKKLNENPFYHNINIFLTRATKIDSNGRITNDGEHKTEINELSVGAKVNLSLLFMRVKEWGMPIIIGEIHKNIIPKFLKELDIEDTEDREDKQVKLDEHYLIDFTFYKLGNIIYDMGNKIGSEIIIDH